MRLLWKESCKLKPIRRRFLPAALIFYLSLFTNTELLLHANIDTFIVFRSAVPIFVDIGESLYLKQPWPSAKTRCSLAIIFGGGVLYVATDYQFTVMAYSWALAYLVRDTFLSSEAGETPHDSQTNSAIRNKLDCIQNQILIKKDGCQF
jgi:hypothetical protein